MTKTNKRPSIIRMPPAGEQPGKLRSISGSDNDDFSTILANQVVKLCGWSPATLISRRSWGRRRSPP